jgi:hypothetical protein
MDVYNGISNIHTTHAKVNDIFTEDENTQGQLEEQIIVRLFEIGEQGRDLKDWATRHANATQPGAPTDVVDDLIIVKS